MSPALWSRAMATQCQATPGSRPLTLALERPDGTVSVYPTHVLPDRQEYAALNLRHIERLVKFLLWQRGGSRVLISGAPEIAAAVSAQYRPEGRRAFDAWFMGDKAYGTPLVIESRAAADMPEARENAMPLGRHLDGCRIGFDLGGSDRKCAAVIDGTVVFSEEIPWDPYFQSDPQYHYDGIMDSLKRAAAHLPRVDAIGGSAAGVYVNNEVRVASLFRGVSASDFELRIRRIFFDLQKAWGGVPFEVVNDGEVTALAGSMAMNENRVLGISLGTSMAAGYVDAAGSIRPWLNELAFAPADFREDGPIDEWSGDLGCGVFLPASRCPPRPTGRPFVPARNEICRATHRGPDAHGSRRRPGPPSLRNRRCLLRPRYCLLHRVLRRRSHPHSRPRNQWCRRRPHHLESPRSTRSGFP